MSLPCLRQTDAGVEIVLLVQPRASRNQVVGLQGGELKLALTAPPVDGAANKACKEYLARICKLSKSRVLLKSGETSRHKRFLLVDAGLRDIQRLLEVSLGA